MILLYMIVNDSGCFCFKEVRKERKMMLELEKGEFPEHSGTRYAIVLMA